MGNIQIPEGVFKMELGDTVFMEGDQLLVIARVDFWKNPSGKTNQVGVSDWSRKT